MKRVGAILLSVLLGACASEPDYSHMRLTEKDRATLRSWAPAFQVLCPTVALDGCRK